MSYSMTSTAQQQRQEAAVRHGAYATQSALKLRQRRLRDRVRRLRAEFPCLANKPRTLLLRFAELETLSAALWLHVVEHGPVGPDGEIRRAVVEYRHLAAELRTLSEVLGLLEHAEDPLASILGKTP